MGEGHRQTKNIFCRKLCLRQRFGPFFLSLTIALGSHALVLLLFLVVMSTPSSLLPTLLSFRLLSLGDGSSLGIASRAVMQVGTWPLRKRLRRLTFGSRSSAPAPAQLAQRPAASAAIQRPDPSGAFAVLRASGRPLQRPTAPAPSPSAAPAARRSGVLAVGRASGPPLQRPAAPSSSPSGPRPHWTWPRTPRTPRTRPRT